MNKLLVLLFFICLSAYASNNAANRYNLFPHNPTNPDITIQSYFGKDAQALLFHKVNKMLKSNTKIDPLNFVNKEKITFTTEIKSKLSKQLNQIVGELVNAPLDKANIEISLDGVEYHIGHVETKLTQLTRSSDSYKFNIHVEFSQVSASTDRAHMIFHIEEGFSSFLDGFWMQIEKPQIISRHLQSIVLDFDLEMYIESEKFRLKITNESIKAYENVDVKEIEESVEIKLGTASAEQIGIEVNGMLFDLNQEGLNAAIKKRTVHISKLLLQPVAMNLATIVTKLGDSISKIEVPKNLNVKFLGKKQKFEIDSFGLVSIDQLQLNINYNSDSLTNKKYDAIKLKNNEFLRSKAEISQSIKDYENHVYLSISENLVNEFIENNYESILEKIELPSILSVGPKKIKMLFDESINGTVVVDLLVKAKGLLKLGLKIMTGQKELRIPIIMNPVIETFRNEKDIPCLKIVFKPVLDDKVLLSDIAGIKNDLTRLKRGQKFVLKQLKKTLLKKTAEIKPIIVPIDVLKGYSLSVIDYKSNGLGRFNVGLNLSPTNSRGKESWQILDELIAPTLKKIQEKIDSNKGKK